MILLSIAARETKIGPERIRQLIAAGEVKAERHGRLYLLRESEIERLKKRGRLKTGPKPGRPRRTAS